MQDNASAVAMPRYVNIYFNFPLKPLLLGLFGWTRCGCYAISNVHHRLPTYYRACIYFYCAAAPLLNGRLFCLFSTAVPLLAYAFCPAYQGSGFPLCRHCRLRRAVRGPFRATRALPGLTFASLPPPPKLPAPVPVYLLRAFRTTVDSRPSLCPPTKVVLRTPVYALLLHHALLLFGRTFVGSGSVPSTMVWRRKYCRVSRTCLRVPVRRELCLLNRVPRCCHRTRFVQRCLYSILPARPFPFSILPAAP